MELSIIKDNGDTNVSLIMDEKAFCHTPEDIIKIIKAVSQCAEHECKCHSAHTQEVKQDNSDKQFKSTAPSSNSVKNPSDDLFNVRQRIPNNTVDISSLTIRQAITENALVRCPHCGQAHALIVSDNNMLYLMRKDYNKDEFVVVLEKDIGLDLNKTLFYLSCKENSDVQERISYYTALQEMSPLDSSSFNVNQDTEIFCPVCHCSNSFLNWKKAWDSPLSFFECENICEICGGECVKSIKHCENGTTKEIIKCEDCDNTWESLKE